MERKKKTERIISVSPLFPGQSEQQSINQSEQKLYTMDGHRKVENNTIKSEGRTKGVLSRDCGL